MKKRNVRKIPNILITGTPGTGKTTLCESLIESYSKLKHFNISDIAIKNNLLDGKDNDRNTFIIDDDKICDYLEDQGVDQINNIGGNVVDYHSSAYFAERYFDLVIILRSKIEVLAKRLRKRKYDEKKVKENVECEIMQICLDEANENYMNVKVLEMKNDVFEDIDNNVKNIIGLIKQWENCH